MRFEREADERVYGEDRSAILDQMMKKHVAVWDGDQLVPFAKAYSGLTDAEIGEVDSWIKKNTLDRFGPVRSVRPELVMEIAFEGINTSARHKSGVALRFPRIARWRKDKKASEADTVATLKKLLETGENGV